MSPNEYLQQEFWGIMHIVVSFAATLASLLSSLASVRRQ